MRLHRDLGSDRDAGSLPVQGFSVRAARVGGTSAADGLWRPAKFDALQLALSVSILCFVWRLQNILPALIPLQIPTVAGLAALGLYILNGDRRRALAGIRHPIVTITLLVLGLAILSIPTSLWPRRSFNFVTNDFIKNIALMLLLSASIRNVQDVRRYAVVHVFGATIYALVAATRYEVGQSGRLGNLLYYDANDLAMVLVATLPLLVYVILSARRLLVRTLVAGATAIVLLALLRTGSRGGFLALFAVIGYLLLRFGGAKVAGRVAAAAAIVIVLLATASEANRNQLRSMLAPKEDYNYRAEAGRWQIWKRGMGYMIQRPFLGVGASAFSQAEGKLSTTAREREAEGRGFRWSAAHNSFVQIGAELGFGGLLAFTALLATVFRTLVSLRRGWARLGTARSNTLAALCDALTACFIGYSVAGFFLSQAYASYLYVTLGMVVGLAKTAVRAGQMPPTVAPVL